MPATLLSKKPLVFNRPGSEVLDRLDVHFNKPEWDILYKRIDTITEAFGFVALDKAVKQFNVGLTTAAKKFYCDNGIPFLRGENVYEDGIDLTSETYIPEEKHNEWQSSQIKPGFIIINLVGNIGDACIVPGSLKNAQINRALGRVIIDEEQFSSEYLVKFLNSDLGKKQLVRYSQGGMQRRFNHPDACHIIIPRISRNDQANILDNYTLIKNRIKRFDELILNIQNAEKKNQSKLNLLFENFLQLPSVTKCQERKIFISKEKNKIDRIDVKGNQPELFHLMKNLNDCSSLESIRSLSTSLNNGVANREYCDIFTDNKKRYLLVADIKSGEITNNNVSYVVSNDHNFTLSEDVLLYTRKGTVGEVAIPKKEHRNAIPCSELMIIEFSRLSYIQREIIRLFLMSDYGKIQSYYFSSGGQMPSISQDRVLSILVPNTTDLLAQQILKEYKNIFTTSKSNQHAINQKIQQREKFVKDLKRLFVDLINPRIRDKFQRKIDKALQ